MKENFMRAFDVMATLNDQKQLLLDDNLDNVLADTFDNNIDYEILNDSYRQNLPTRIIGSLIYSPWD